MAVTGFRVIIDGIDPAATSFGWEKWHGAGERIVRDPVTRTPAKLPGARKYADITLKRGKTSNDKALWDWIKSTADGVGDKRSITIIEEETLPDGTSKPVKTYTFHSAWPSKWTGPTLDARGTCAPYEMIEFNFGRVEVT